MSVYGIVLYLHIVGALGLFVTLGLEWAGVYFLRRVTTAVQAREWAKLLGILRFVGGPAALTLLATGMYMSATRWGGHPWIGLSLLGLVLIAALGGGLSGRRLRAIAGALREEDGPVSAELLRRLRDPVLILSAWLRTALALGIVFLMSAKPGSGGALSTVGVALAVGLAAGLASRGGARPPVAAT